MARRNTPMTNRGYRCKVHKDWRTTKRTMAFRDDALGQRVTYAKFGRKKGRQANRSKNAGLYLQNGESVKETPIEECRIDVSLAQRIIVIHARLAALVKMYAQGLSTAFALSYRANLIKVFRKKVYEAARIETGLVLSY